MFRFPTLSLLASALIGCKVKAPELPLQENLGTRHMAISSRNERAQTYFNQECGSRKPGEEATPPDSWAYLQA
jgi:hypothetical protein